MKKKKLFLIPLLMSSAIAMTGCSMSDGITDKLTGTVVAMMHTQGGDDIDDVSPDGESLSDGMSTDIFGDDVTGDSSQNEDGFQNTDMEESDVLEGYYTEAQTYGDTQDTSKTSENKPMYSAEYYFNLMSDMELPEGATADREGNIHYKGYRLLKAKRDMLPASAVVGAEINYEIYVNGLPDKDISANSSIDSSESITTEPETNGVNRVKEAVEEAARIKENVNSKENVAANSYEAISQEAAESVGKTSKTGKDSDSQKFVPATPDEDPEYEGKLVSVERNGING